MVNDIKKNLMKSYELKLTPMCDIIKKKAEGVKKF